MYVMLDQGYQMKTDYILGFKNDIFSYQFSF
jgi:hypothetical protein